MRGQSALLEAHQFVVDGDLVGDVVTRLSELDHLLQKISQLNLQRLQLSVDPGSLRGEMINRPSPALQ